MIRVAKLSVIFLSVGLAVSCARKSDLGSLQTRVDGVEAEVSSAESTVAEALSAAQSAESKAAGAAADARAARAATEEISAKLDRGFRKGMMNGHGKAKSGVFKANRASPSRPSNSQPASYQDQGRDKFQEIKGNPVKLAKEEPVSTFSIDVDTASYAFVRASLNRNVLPQKDAVRLEELINYFPYDYAAPDNREEPFKANISVFPAPWNTDTKLIHIGIKGYKIDPKEKPRSNLVFLIDTSGSMNEPNKLPLVQTSLKMLLDTLNEDDSVAIVTYAGHAGIALEPTRIKEKHKISGIIDNLAAGGSTAGAEGIRQAYQLAERNFDKEGINRVILATDGDFNVGISDTNRLYRKPL
jgi:Ca-activated chloride channel family protein